MQEESVNASGRPRKGRKWLQELNRKRKRHYMHDKWIHGRCNGVNYCTKRSAKESSDNLQLSRIPSTE